MFRRDCPENLIAALNASSFWPNIIADRELQPEIRHGRITVYYRGRAIIREICLRGGEITGKIHRKYIAVEQASLSNRSEYVNLVADPRSGWDFASPIRPRPLGLCSKETLKEHKERAATAVSYPEALLTEKIIGYKGNQILDQEIEFDDAGSSEGIDLCSYDPTARKLVFVEVKRVVDDRLLANGHAPEVLQQLRGYARRLSRHRNELLSAYQRTTAWKRELGLGDRLQNVPVDGPQDMLDKPILVIGDCKNADLEQILRGEGQWGPLMAGLPEVAAGLIVCLKSGCRLRLKADSRMLVF